MRKAFVGLLGAVMGLAMLAAPVSTASAQALSVSIFGGGVFPTGDVGELIKTGWIVGANVDHRFGGGKSPVSVRLDLAYGSSSFEDFGVGSAGSFDLKLNNIYGLVYALLHPNIGQSDKASVDLYVGGGGGFVRSSFSGSSADDTDVSETNGALSGVVGGSAPVGGIRLFFEGRWVLVFFEDASESLFPVVAGITIPL